MSAPEGHGYIDFVGDEEHFWRIETLWRAAEGQEARSVALDDIPWREDGCYVLGEPPTWLAFAQHVARVHDANLEYPIILGPAGEVVDGMHRIVRAFMDGRGAIDAVRLPRMPPPDRVRPRDA